ncbi:MAG: hypothetical protein ACR2HF_04720 [Methylococcaceae bacterium]
MSHSPLIDGIEPHLTLPTAEPIRASFAEGAIEADLKRLFADLFEQQIARRLFDANSLGVPHLGTFDLVRQSINTDGLSLLPGSTEQEATRYLYRAWKARDLDGRGTAFLNTYLQMLFPNVCSVEQMMQSKRTPYPLDLYPASTHGGDPDKFLTSRVEITLDWAVEMSNFNQLMSVFRAVIPARLTPLFRVRLVIILLAQHWLESNLDLRKWTYAFANPCGLKLSETEQRRWTLGRDADVTRLGSEPVLTGKIVDQLLPRLKSYYQTSPLEVDGSWQVGKWMGGHALPPPPRLDASWQLGRKTGQHLGPVVTDCKLASSAALKIDALSRVFHSPWLGEFGRKVDGGWRLHATGHSTAMVSRSILPIEPDTETTFGEHHRLVYPKTPQKLGRVWPLGTWRAVDGRWQIGKPSSSPFGFSLRDAAILGETRKQIEKITQGYVNPDKFKLKPLARVEHGKLDGRWRVGGEARSLLRLDSTWAVGGSSWPIHGTGQMESLSVIYAPSTTALASCAHFTLRYDGAVRLSRLPKLNAWHRLDGSWALNKAETRSPFGFGLKRDSLPIDSSAAVSKAALIDVSPPITLPKSRALNAQWQVGRTQKALALDASWQVGGRMRPATSTTALNSLGIIAVSPTAEVQAGEQAIIHYPYRSRLGRPARLNAWTHLDGTWGVGGAFSKSPFGFALREAGIQAEARSSFEKHTLIDVFGKPSVLPSMTKIDGRPLDGAWRVGGGDSLRLNGRWQVGRYAQFTASQSIVESSSELPARPAIEVETGQQFDLHYPRNKALPKPARLNAWTHLDGTWGVGGAFSKSPFGFALLPDRGITAEAARAVALDKVIDVFDRYHTLSRTVALTPTVQLNGKYALNGQWQVGGSDGSVRIDGKWQVGGSFRHTVRRLDGAWRLGRVQVVCSSIDISIQSALDLGPAIDFSISTYTGNAFIVDSGTGAEVSYFLTTTDKTLIDGYRIRLPSLPYGDIYHNYGLVFRDALENGDEIAEDHGNVLPLIEGGVGYAVFDRSVDINGLYAQVTYLARA